MNGITTKATHAGYTPNNEHGAVIPPLHLSTTFTFGNEGGYEYSRSGNPTRQVLEQTLAALEDARFALAFSSGSAVLAAVSALLQGDQSILFSSDAYGGTYRYLTKVLDGKRSHTVDFTDLTAVQTMLQTHSNVRIVWLETPTNPLLKVADIAKIAELAHAHQALLVVDNTFATPVLQQPLALGADIVVYSTTKYINGHSDSIGGSLSTNSQELYDQLKFLQNAMGSMLSPFDSWLTLRGVRTLELRMKQHVANAEALVEVLHGHPKVEKVYYPALFTGTQGNIVKKQQSHGGAIISVELAEKYDARKFTDALRYFPLAESLGGVESLIDHPASMTHASIPKAERKKIGLSDGLLRLSVGIENTEDLVKDIRQALAKL